MHSFLLLEQLTNRFELLAVYFEDFELIVDVCLSNVLLDDGVVHFHHFQTKIQIILKQYLIEKKN